MKNNKTLSKLNSYIAGNRKYLILVIISALLANIFMLVAPYISGRAIDFIKGENNVDFPMVAKFIGILFAVYQPSYKRHRRSFRRPFAGNYTAVFGYRNGCRFACLDVLA